MDLSDPTRAVTATLDGPVLAVMASAGKPLTVGQVAGLAVRGSEIGIRRSLDRLAGQGIVRATIIGRTQVYELNHDHLAAQVAFALAGLRSELWRRLREEMRGWTVQPLYAAVFGSAARGDGDEASDIDLLLVHPPFPDEKPPGRIPRSGLQQVQDLITRVANGPSEPDPLRTWERQLDQLRDRVEAWTGNPAQLVDLTAWEWRYPPEGHQQLLADIDRDAVELISPALPILAGARRAR